MSVWMGVGAAESGEDWGRRLTHWEPLNNHSMDYTLLEAIANQFRAILSAGPSVLKPVFQ